MQDIQMTAQDLIDDLTEQVTRLTQEGTYFRAERSALVRRIDELEQIVAQQNEDLQRALKSIEDKADENTPPRVIEGEVE
jgi:uncharacterized coiled-coil DUF342 family protein